MFQQKHRREIWSGAAGQEQADGWDVIDGTSGRGRKLAAWAF